MEEATTRVETDEEIVTAILAGLDRLEGHVHALRGAIDALERELDEPLPVEPAGGRFQ